MTTLPAPAWTPAPALLAPAPGDVHVLALALDLPAPRIAALGTLLSPDESDRAGRFHRPEHRCRYIAGRGQLRAILGWCLGREPARLAFRCNDYGKPSLEGPGAQHLHFNLSRSDGLGLVAIQLDDDVGVDIEMLRPFPDALPIAERFFAPEERSRLRALPAAERAAAFFDVWTRKEAVLKSIGLGLSQPMDGFALAPRAAPAEPVVVMRGDEVHARWLWPVRPAEDRVASVATASARCLIHCWTWPDR